MSDDVTDELRAADRRWTELRRGAIEDLDAAREQITSLGVEELRFMVLERVMLDTQSERVRRGRAKGWWATPSGSTDAGGGAGLPARRQAARVSFALFHWSGPESFGTRSEVWAGRSFVGRHNLVSGLDAEQA
jgi:hypothetical protein